MTVKIIHFEVIKGENKGKKVYSFQEAYADALMSPIQAIPTYDNDYEYVMFLNELKMIGEEIVEAEDDIRTESKSNP